MSKSFTEFDRPYRRGLVLGLSLAELFLILLFLLLLAAIGMAQNERENNEKLVETLKLVPSEPFLGIEGLHLGSGFGSTKEQEEKTTEKEIKSLKEIKVNVRDFIKGRVEYIFDLSQHHQLSVKEYLKTL